MNTEEDPRLIEAVCLGHFLPGRRWPVDTSPTLAAPRPLIFTSPDAEAMVYPLQCGTPASPFLAAAGMFYLHQSLKLWHPRINFIMLFWGMWAWRDFGTEFYYMIEHSGYVFISAVFMQLARDHDHEPVWHANQL